MVEQLVAAGPLWLCLYRVQAPAVETDQVQSRDYPQYRRIRVLMSDSYPYKKCLSALFHTGYPIAGLKCFKLLLHAFFAEPFENPTGSNVPIIVTTRS